MNGFSQTVSARLKSDANDLPTASGYIPDDARSCLHKRIEFHRAMLAELEQELSQLSEPEDLTLDQWLKESVCSLIPHDTRLTNMLEERGIFLVRDLINTKAEHLLAIPNFAHLNLLTVYRALTSAGFKVPIEV